MRTPLWKSIKDFPGYSISKYGQVSRIKRRFGGGMSRRILNPIPDQGFSRCALYPKGKRHLLYVNNLVAEAFLPEPQDARHLFYVAHINGDFQNNDYRNLRYVYAGRNAKHAQATWLGVQRKRLERDFRIKIES
jgi:hypothetical protein